MAINTSLLIAAPMLQDFLISKTGIPLAAGVVTCYSNTNQTTLKNWYYQSGQTPPYAYLPLPNPMTLSAAGTIVDVNGNDVIPFFYPFASDNTTPETYFITVYDQFGTFQFSRYNFPFTGSGGSPSNGVSTLENYIINNRFWRNAGTIVVPTSGSGQYQVTVAPSQHDGFSFPDIQYIKSVYGATETITFTQFPTQNTQVLTGDITPEFYINHNCTVAQAGETQKVYQFPISLHLLTLDNVPYTVTLQAQGVSGTQTITVFLYQFTGTGTSSPAPKLIAQGTLNLTTAWTKYFLSDIFPSSVGLVIGAGGDDAYYLQIGMPLAATCGINFTLPSLYLSNQPSIPTNNFATYDQIDTVINSPRTGDLRQSMNTFSPFGWVPMNDGSIGSAASSATTRNNIDTWPLYNLIYTSILDHWAPVSGGRTGMSTANAYTDFTANKTLTLPRSLGRVLMGDNGGLTTPQAFATNYGASHFNLIVVSTAQYPTGTPIQLTSTGSLPANLSANTIYYAINTSSTTIQLATTIENAYASTAIDIGGNQVSVSTIYSASGAYVGESLHVLVASELPDPITSTALTANFTAGAVTGIASGAAHASGIVSNNGGGNGHNTIQPSTFANVFIKL